jgi:hypothetical protein
MSCDDVDDTIIRMALDQSWVSTGENHLVLTWVWGGATRNETGATTLVHANYEVCLHLPLLFLLYFIHRLSFHVSHRLLH